jgi:steroid 5-alpha reductase family enzyme
MNDRDSSLVSLAVIIFTSILVYGLSLNGTQWHGIPVFVTLAAISFVIQWIVFLPSFLLKTEHVFDLTGTATYLTLLLIAVFVLSPELGTRDYLLLTMIGIWALRLGTFLFRRVRKADGDSRFTEMKTKFWWFLMTWNLQALWVFLTAAAALAAIVSPQKSELQFIGWIGIALWLFGFAFEVVADRQKTVFRSDPTNKGKFICHGLWARSRHPNYFGEMVLWFGVAVVAYPALESWRLLTLISPIFVTLLLTKVSGVPLLEEQGKERWGADPEYQRYLETTPVLIPRFFTRPAGV